MTSRTTERDRDEEGDAREAEGHHAPLLSLDATQGTTNVWQSRVNRFPLRLYRVNVAADDA
jgi:hypothetical protein